MNPWAFVLRKMGLKVERYVAEGHNDFLKKLEYCFTFEKLEVGN